MEQRRIFFAIVVGMSLLTTLVQAAPHRDSQKNLKDSGQNIGSLDSDSGQRSGEPEQNVALPDVQDFEQDANGGVRAISHRPTLIRTDTNDPVVQLVTFPRG
jgi:hypothetical protein